MKHEQYMMLKMKYLNIIRAQRKLTDTMMLDNLAPRLNMTKNKFEWMRPEHNSNILLMHIFHNIVCNKRGEELFLLTVQRKTTQALSLN